MLRLLFILMPSLLIACSKDKPAPVATAGKVVAVPPAPTNLRFDAPTDSSCTVRWDASDGAIDYDVNYRKAQGGRWTNEPHKGTRLYNTIYDLEPNTEYRWAVRAENSDGASEWIHGPNFTTLPSEDDGSDDVAASPTNLRFDDPTATSCTVRWDAVEGAIDYDVNYKPAVGGRWINEPHKGVRLYNTIYDLEPNTEYRWAVRAENRDGPSKWVFGDRFATLADVKEESDLDAEVTLLLSDREILVLFYEAMDGDYWKNSKRVNWLSDAPLGEWKGVTTDEEGRVIKLRVDSAGLSGPLPPELGQLDKLELLHFIYNNGVTGPIPPELGDLKNLRGLYLNDRQLTGPIPPELGQLDSLEYLYIKGEQLGGRIPPELGNLENLIELELGSRLTGPIPSELGGLKNLRLLNLGWNQLSGSIPKELSNLDSLEYLALHRNRLTGQIPVELANLKNLQALSLRYNGFSGCLPGVLVRLDRNDLRDFYSLPICEKMGRRN